MWQFCLRIRNEFILPFYLQVAASTFSLIFFLPFALHDHNLGQKRYDPVTYVTCRTDYTASHPERETESANKCVLIFRILFIQNNDWIKYSNAVSFNFNILWQLYILCKFILYLSGPWPEAVRCGDLRDLWDRLHCCAPRGWNGSCQVSQEIPQQY